MGDCPRWYTLISAARYLGVPPWDLAARPYTWVLWSVEAEAAEIDAANQRQERENRRARRRK